jgi:hypothetical protein
MSFDQYDMIAKKLFHLKDVLFKTFCITLSIGLIFFSWQLFLQVKTFNNLTDAILQEQASRENLQQAMLARSRLRSRQIEEVVALTGREHGSAGK